MLSLLVSLCVLAAPCTSRSGPAASSPDGHLEVFVSRDEGRTDDAALGPVPHEDLCISRPGAPATVLLAGRGGDAAEQTLVSFEGFVFSPDSKTLFFTTTGWVTSTAAHAVELATGKERYLFDGAIKAPITRGPDAGRYVAAHFRLDDAHPNDSPKYLGRVESWSIVTAAGKTVRKISEAQAQKWLKR